jgi:SAM-dependent methyltransferase
VLPSTAEARADLRSRERAEIARSEVEARLGPGVPYRLTPRTIERYANARAGTAFPLEYAFHLLGDVRGRTVLDCGAGAGRNGAVLAARGARVVAVDISAALLGIARRTARANRLEASMVFACASAHRLPFPDEAIDLVFGNAVLHHLDVPVAAREIHRVLRPGGRAVFREPLRNSRLVRLLRGLVPGRPVDVSPYERPLTDADLAAAAAPFSGIRSRVFALPFVRAAESVPVRSTLVHRLYRADAAALRRARWLRRYAGIVVFELTKASGAAGWG